MTMCSAPPSFIPIQQIYRSSFFFFFNDTATTEIYTLSLHDALPIYWIVMPLRRTIKPAGRWDMSSLIAAFLLQLLQFVLLWLLMGGQSTVVALPWLALCGLARVALSGMVGVLLIYAILSWVQPQSPMYGVLQRLSEDRKSVV